MSEAKFVEQFKKHLVAQYPDSHMSCIESPITSPGIPDVDFCVNGKEVKVEFKYSANGLGPEIRPTQVRWFKKRLKAGSNPWLMAKIYVDEEWLYFLVKGMDIVDLARSSGLGPWHTHSYRVYDEVEMDQGGWFSMINIMVKPQ